MNQNDLAAVVISGALAAGVAVAANKSVKNPAPTPKAAQTTRPTLEVPATVMKDGKKCLVFHPKQPDGSVVEKTFCPDGQVMDKTTEAPTKK